MTYDPNAYANEQREDASRVREACEVILREFTGWTHDAKREARYDSNGWGKRIAFLTDGDRLISVTVSHDDRNRISVHGECTPERTDAYQQGFNRDLHEPRITVSADRIDKLAREVSRRVLPQLDAANKTYRERVAAHDAYQNAKGANLSRLAQAVGVAVWTPSHANDDQRVTWHYDTPAGYGEAKAYDNSAALELHGLSVDLAVRILTTLREARDFEDALTTARKRFPTDDDAARRYAADIIKDT